jgi:signal transduction histidine kinase
MIAIVAGRMRTSRMSRAAWPLCWVTLLLTAVGLWLALRNGAGVRDVSHVPFVVACAVAGGLLARHRPANPVGWLLLANAVSFALLDACGQAATYGTVTRPGAVPGADALAWPQTWLWVPANAALTVVAAFFPDGRLLSPRWRLPLAAYAALAAVTAVAGAVRPGRNAQVGPTGAPNPLGVDGWLPVAAGTEAAFGVACLLLFVTAAGTVVRRARAERGVRRQQLKWLGYALALSILVVVGRLAAGLTDGRPDAVWPAESTAWDVAGGLATTAIPVALGIAILRHRLFDIDLIISRSVVYLILSVLVGGAYLAVVGVLGASASIVAAAAAALLLTPVRDRLQRRVDQLVYGERDDPYAVLSRLGARLEQVQEPGAVLAAGAATVKDALQLSYVGVRVAGGHTYELGTRPGRPVDLPLVAAGEPVGRLRLGPRPGEATLSGRDLRLLRDLARQLAVAARALRAADRAQRLSEDLQRSRERLVVAREEERRRLRRDLHDGLGPTLAGLTMRAEAALELGGGPEAARLLEEIVADTQTAIADVRRLVDGLRPPALDTMGLAGALRAHVTGWPADSGPRVTFDAPDPLPPLGAATEVAAYRIAVEALANARRHAGARHVEVRLDVAGERLRVTVADDGTGLDAAAGAGVGLHSLRERAAELGGVCRVSARPSGGTLVAASLPLALATTKGVG